MCVKQAMIALLGMAHVREKSKPLQRDRVMGREEERVREGQ